MCNASVAESGPGRAHFCGQIVHGRTEAAAGGRIVLDGTKIANLPVLARMEADRGYSSRPGRSTVMKRYRHKCAETNYLAEHRQHR